MEPLREPTVGIVSALWKEAAAIRMLVNDIRPVPAKPNDRNQYQEGWLPSTDSEQVHWVVLALLPQDGTGNASAVCADLFHSYPELECVVMCGIAGGIPNPGDPEQHVRLGDVVVADEIVSYGNVRRTDGEEVLRRPTAGRSADLMRAVHELRIGELAGSHPWRAWLDGTDSRLTPFRRPPADSDVLYVAGVPVSHPDLTMSSHDEGWPKVHYGPIGSADVLLRDEIYRDELAADHRFLAVEMEASGIASATVLRNRAWFVVRGVVDYCENAGKTDVWHLYSSLAAAAYVRALLERCHPFGRSQVQSSSLPGPLRTLPQVWNIPVRFAAFTGRDQMLLQLRDRLAAGGPVLVQALAGQGGVGKTQLAIEYAHRFANSFDLAWWIDAERPALIGEQLAALAAAMNLVNIDATIPAAVARAKQYLGSRSGWLLVFDNADNPSDVLAWLPEGPGQVIITSRHDGWRQVAADVIEVDVFVRAESIALLRRLTPTLPAQNADIISEQLGDLPLAVAQAGSVLAESILTADQYLEELTSRAAAVLDEGRLVSYSRSLAATVRLSVDGLSDNSPAAVQLLRVCATLGAEPIPMELFSDVSVDVLPNPLATHVREPLAFGRVVSTLLRSGLARRRDSDESGLRYSLLLHRLTREILLDLLDPRERRQLARQAEALVLAAEPKDPSDPAQWPRWSAILPHLLALDPAHSDNERLQSFAVLATWFMLARGDLTAGLLIADELYTIWRDRLGEDHDTSLRAAYTLAEACRMSGRPEKAKQLDIKTLAHRRRIDGSDDLETLRLASNLAVDLNMLGEHEQAQSLNVDTLARRHRILGADHRETLYSTNNYAHNLRELGEYDQARQLDEDTLRRRRRIMGESHPETLLSASNLATDLRHLGEYGQAREIDKDTLDRRRQVLGENHPDTRASADAFLDPTSPADDPD